LAGTPADDERDIDKNIWRLRIPEFDSANALHAEISALGLDVEIEVQDEGRSYITLRQQIRRFLEQESEGSED
jgi:hypothetical protein